MDQLLAYALGACVSGVPATSVGISGTGRHLKLPNAGFEDLNFWIILGMLPIVKRQITPRVVSANPLIDTGIEFRDRDEGPDHIRDLLK